MFWFIEIMEDKSKSKWEEVIREVKEVRNNPKLMKLLDDLIKFHTS